MKNSEKLELIIKEIELLINKKVTVESNDYVTWYTRAKMFLLSVYGYNSEQFRTFDNRRFSTMNIVSTYDQDIAACKKGLEKTKAEFSVYLEDIIEKENACLNNERDNNEIGNKKVFIVHGHDEILKQAVARIVEKQGIEAIILSEKANQGRTIIEKIEEYSDVGAAICLFTNDDEGKEQSEKDLKPRARQNVVFEAGYFIGYLGRNKVVIISDEDNELPGDLGGVVYTGKEEWKGKLAVELENMGFIIDYKKLYA